MGICDYQDGHPAEAWEVMANAPWGVRLACRLLQERAKGEDSDYAPYIALIPESVPGSPLMWTDDEVAAYLLADGETTLNAAKVREIEVTLRERDANANRTDGYLRGTHLVRHEVPVEPCAEGDGRPL